MSQRPRTNEKAFNALFAEVLRGKHPLWKEYAAAEQTRVLGRSQLQPDVVIRHPSGQPVILETEFMPASTVEKDAKERLGEELAATGQLVNQALAVRIPAELRGHQGDLAKQIGKAVFEYCVFSKSSDQIVRWPDNGWLNGSIDNLARCIEHALLSEHIIAQGMDVLEGAVRQAAQIMADEEREGFADAAEGIADKLHQSPGKQTIRLAMTILANAMVFHTVIAGAHSIPPISSLRTGRGVPLPNKQRVLDCWYRIIHEINYWPIFAIAISILDTIPERAAQRVLSRLADAAGELTHVGITTMHDLTGRMFQNLVADRKFLATFYTLPVSAALLAELSVSRVPADLTKAHDYSLLKIADFACGTGTLLSAAYQAVLARYRRIGRNDQHIHPHMLEKALIAADIMPAATHLAASQLSSAHPAITFKRTNVFTIPYGRGDGDAQAISIGSLDLIDANQAPSLFPTGQHRLHGVREGNGQEQQEAYIPHGSVDWVIMNPPFTSPTNHKTTTVPVPSFAGFDTPAEEQQAMSDRLKAIRAQILRARTNINPELPKPAGHGNAGLASNFLDLAHAKVKERGVISMVLPLAFVKGDGWKNARELLATQYRNITVISISATGVTNYAFSADTGMGEVLLVANRSSLNQGSDKSLFVNLYRRPRSLMEASEIAAAINLIPKHSNSGLMSTGETPVGNYARMPLIDGGGGVGLINISLARTMLDLQQGEFRIPRLAHSFAVSLTRLKTLGTRGLVHRDINGITDGNPRGPFDIGPTIGVPDYPALWSHKASKERRLVVSPDCQGNVREGCEASGKSLADRDSLALHAGFSAQFAKLGGLSHACPRNWRNRLAKLRHAESCLGEAHGSLVQFDSRADDVLVGRFTPTARPGKTYHFTLAGTTRIRRKKPC